MLTQSIVPTGAAGRLFAVGRSVGAPGDAAIPARSTVREAAVATTQVILELEETLQASRTDLKIHVDEKSGKTIIKVVDPETKEVVRQFPPEALLTLSRHASGSHGLLFNDRA